MRVKKPIELAVLQKVAAQREREARGRNVPRSRILKDDTIYEIAQQQPVDAEALARLRTIPKGERSQSGTATARGRRRGTGDLRRPACTRLPRQTHVPEGAASASEMLKVLLKIVSEKEGVAAKIICQFRRSRKDRYRRRGSGCSCPAWLAPRSLRRDRPQPHRRQGGTTLRRQEDRGGRDLAASKRQTDNA